MMNTITPNYNINTRTLQTSSPNIRPLNFTGTSRLAKDTVEFSKKVLTEKDYLKAQKYADRISKMPKFLFFKEKSLKNLNMDKIEGLQYGIPVFDGMSMKEIAFATDSIHSVATLRSCENACLHCYADARPNKIFEKTEGLTNRMTFEDFQSLTDGIGELQKRLGNISINSTQRNNGRDKIAYTAISLFHDSDSIGIYLKDKNGKTHEFPELNKMLIDSTGQKGFFDTAGWNPNDKKAQGRAKEIAAYYANDAHNSELEQFNISINTFNPWNVKAVQLRKEGKFEEADRITDKYVDRIANVIHTFTPELTKPYFGIILRALPDNTKNAEGLCENDLKNLRYKIFEKVTNKYKDHLYGNPKYEAYPDIFEYYHNAIKALERKMFAPIDTEIISSGRLAKYTEKNKIEMPEDSIHNELYNAIKTNPKDKEAADNFFKIIDANGKLYLSDYVVDIPTDIQFKFSSNGLKTPEFGNLDPNLKFSKDSL